MKFTQHAIQRAFDASVEDLFDEFENIPVASGSIGQVYRAKLSAKGARNTGIDAGGRCRFHMNPLKSMCCVQWSSGPVL